MFNYRKLFGAKAEKQAVAFLKKNGYKIIEKNYRTKLGEIDIIAKERDTLVFVEVKARKTKDFGNPKSAVTPKKMKKISMVALEYIKTIAYENKPARFDVVAICYADGREQIEIIKNAFELAYG